MFLGITLKDDGTLIIERVKKDDEGMYECHASNAEGVAISSAVITVVGEYLSPHLLSVILIFFRCCRSETLYLYVL